MKLFKLFGCSPDQEVEFPQTGPMAGEALSGFRTWKVRNSLPHTRRVGEEKLRSGEFKIFGRSPAEKV